MKVDDLMVEDNGVVSLLSAYVVKIDVISGRVVDSGMALILRICSDETKIYLNVNWHIIQC